MAVNNISLTSIETQTVNTANRPFVKGSSKDIIEHLGTNLGTTSYTNPIGSNIIITESSAPTNGSTAAWHNRNNNDFVGYTTGTNVDWEFTNGYEVDINAYSVFGVTTSSYPTAWRIQVSDDAINWITIDTTSGAFGGTGGQRFDFICPNRTGFHKYVRYNLISAFNGNTGFLAEIYFFGRLRNLITGVADYIQYNGTMSSYANTDLNNNLRNRVIKYEGGSWNATPRVPWRVEKLNMSSNFTVTQTVPTLYVVSPNGANRVITLPASPSQNDAYKFKNLDGAFDLTIEETPGDPTPVVMNNAGKLQYEFVYDGTEWLVTG